MHKVLLNKKVKLLCCGQCDYVTTQSLRMTEHQNAHSQTRNFACELCDKSFVVKSTLDQHMSFVHRHGQKQKCPYCPYETHAKKKLTYHLKVSHTHKHCKPFACPYCSFVCKTSNNTGKHIRLKHPGREVKWKKLLDITTKEVYDVVQRDIAAGVCGSSTRPKDVSM